MKLKLLIDKGEIAKAKEHVLKEAQKQSKLKGFRQGKAPISMVEESIGQQNLQQSIIEHVLPEIYANEIKKQSIKPISYPKFSLKKIVEGDDWEFEAEVAEKPEINISGYKEAVKKAKAELAAKQAKDNIWVPGKDKKPEEDTQEKLEKKQDDRLRAVFDALLTTIKFEVPQMLVDEEVNRSLSRLLNQVGKLGLTIEQYLESMGTSSEKLRSEYAKTATETLKLELILQEIAADLKVTIPIAEIDKMIDAVGDSETKKKLNTPSEKAEIEAMLVKRKTVDALLSL